MNALKPLATLVLASVALAASATAEDGVLISMTLERDGIQLATPKVLAEWNTEASLQHGEDYRIVILPSVNGEFVKMQMTLSAAGPSGMTLAGHPSVTTRLEMPASVSWQSADGVRYKLTLTPFKAPLAQNAFAAH